MPLQFLERGVLIAIVIADAVNVDAGDVRWRMFFMWWLNIKRLFDENVTHILVGQEDFSMTESPNGI